MRKIIFFLIFSLLKIVQFQEDENIVNLIHMAKKYGFELTEPEDLFFHDICRHFRYIKKDLTLNYRRKYYFFPKNKNDILSVKLINQIALRNNSNMCFQSNNSFLNFFTNIVFLCFFPLFIIQFVILLVSIFLKLDNSAKNTPLQKLQTNKNIRKNKKVESIYSEFIPEIDTNQKKIEENAKAPINDLNITEQILKNEINTENVKSDLIRNSASFYNDDNDNYGNNNNNVNNNAIINENNNSNGNINNEEEDKDKKKDDKNEPPIAVEKSTDNYTFGMKFGKEIKFSSNFSINKIIKNDKKEEKKDKKENKEDKYKRIQYIYNQMNQKRLNIKKNIQNINTNTPLASIPAKQTQTNEIFYIREEYFYFGYALATLEDKRTIIEIYIDLLEQCQIFFKLFLSPFNIYEDRNLQIFYYLTKINLYFLFNCLLITSQVINDIYDNKHYFISDFKRSIFATIYTYIVSFFIYYLTNVKKQLIRRRYKLQNLKITDSRLNTEIARFTLNFCLNFLFNKILLLMLAFLIIFFYSVYVCFSFCYVYYYSQLLLLKCVLISITLSQITPIIACWLPAFLRYIILIKKKGKKINLYNLLKYLELLYIA